VGEQPPIERPGLGDELRRAVVDDHLAQLDAREFVSDAARIDAVLVTTLIDWQTPGATGCPVPP